MGASTGISAELGAFARSAGILDAENLHSLVRRVQVRLGLVAVRFGLLQIALGDGVMLIQVLCADLILVRKAVGICRLQIGSPATANNRGC